MITTASKTSHIEQLCEQLKVISNLLGRYIEWQRQNFPTSEAEYRGVYVSDEEVDAILADPHLLEADVFTAWPSMRLNFKADNSRLTQLQTKFGLNDFELGVILLAVAPEIDPRFQKLYVYAQDDVKRRRPGIEFAWRLFCPTLSAQLIARGSFRLDAPLLRHHLIELIEDAQVGLCDCSFKLDERITGFLLGNDELDSHLHSLVAIAEAGQPDTLTYSTECQLKQLIPMLEKNEVGPAKFICNLYGRDQAAQLNLAKFACEGWNCPLLILDVSELADPTQFPLRLQLVKREALLRNAAIYCVGYDALQGEEAQIVQLRRQLDRFVDDFPGVSFITTTSPVPTRQNRSNAIWLSLEVAVPSYSEQQTLWAAQLGEVAAQGLNLTELASRYKLTTDQITAAATTARTSAHWRGEHLPNLADLTAACRIHSTPNLENLAQRLTPCYTWDDLVLAAEPKTMLGELCQQIKGRAVVFEQWGFGKRLSRGKGINAVFAGPSGTGKTMAAEVIAGELGMDIYRINLATVVSKYIGETEKNLERIFNEAANSNVILFFDEADTLFGKRGEVKDAHDRYANLETGYLLQKLEDYEGVVILATNLRKNMDDAFTRRMNFVIEFPLPNQEDYVEIWRRYVSDRLPLSPDVDIESLTQQFKLTAGNIKNIALTAVFLAACSEETRNQVETTHLLQAIRREYQKLGRIFTEIEFVQHF